MPSDRNRTSIYEWVAVAPDSRVIETARHGDCWTTQALEDGEVRYEETEFGREEPELNLIARWCERQVNDVRTSGSFACAAIGWSHIRVSMGGTDYADWIRSQLSVCPLDGGHKLARRLGHQAIHIQSKFGSNRPTKHQYSQRRT